MSTVSGDGAQPIDWANKAEDWANKAECKSLNKISYMKDGQVVTVDVKASTYSFFKSKATRLADNNKKFTAVAGILGVDIQQVPRLAQISKKAFKTALSEHPADRGGADLAAAKAVQSAVADLQRTAEAERNISKVDLRAITSVFDASNPFQQLMEGISVVETQVQSGNTCISLNDLSIESQKKIANSFLYAELSQNNQHITNLLPHIKGLGGAQPTSAIEAKEALLKLQVLQNDLNKLDLPKGIFGDKIKKVIANEIDASFEVLLNTIKGIPPNKINYTDYENLMNCVSGVLQPGASKELRSLVNDIQIQVTNNFQSSVSAVYEQIATLKRGDTSAPLEKAHLAVIIMHNIANMKLPSSGLPDNPFPFGSKEDYEVIVRAFIHDVVPQEVMSEGDGVGVSDANKNAPGFVNSTKEHLQNLLTEQKGLKAKILESTSAEERNFYNTRNQELSGEIPKLIAQMDKQRKLIGEFNKALRAVIPTNLGHALPNISLGESEMICSPKHTLSQMDQKLGVILREHINTAYSRSGPTASGELWLDDVYTTEQKVKKAVENCQSIETYMQENLSFGQGHSWCDAAASDYYATDMIQGFKALGEKARATIGNELKSLKKLQKKVLQILPAAQNTHQKQVLGQVSIKLSGSIQALKELREYFVIHNVIEQLKVYKLAETTVSYCEPTVVGKVLENFNSEISSLNTSDEVDESYRSTYHSHKRLKAFLEKKIETSSDDEQKAQLTEILGHVNGILQRLPKTHLQRKCELYLSKELVSSEYNSDHSPQTWIDKGTCQSYLSYMKERLQTSSGDSSYTLVKLEREGLRAKIKEISSMLSREDISDDYIDHLKHAQVNLAKAYTQLSDQYILTHICGEGASPPQNDWTNEDSVQAYYDSCQSIMMGKGAKAPHETNLDRESQVQVLMNFRDEINHRIRLARNVSSENFLLSKSPARGKFAAAVKRLVAFEKKLTKALQTVGHIHSEIREKLERYSELLATNQAKLVSLKEALNSKSDQKSAHDKYLKEHPEFTPLNSSSSTEDFEKAAAKLSEERQIVTDNADPAIQVLDEKLKELAATITNCNTKLSEGLGQLNTSKTHLLNALEEEKALLQKLSSSYAQGLFQRRSETRLKVDALINKITTIIRSVKNGEDCSSIDLEPLIKDHLKYIRDDKSEAQDTHNTLRQAIKGVLELSDELDKNQLLLQTSTVDHNRRSAEKASKHLATTEKLKYLEFVGAYIDQNKLLRDQQEKNTLLEKEIKDLTKQEDLSGYIALRVHLLS